MLTPQEVSEHAFAKASFGGYNMAMVDEFLDQLTEDYTALYKENAALKSKMKVLVDKVEEYRSTEDAMRKTLLTAQNVAEQMIKEAEEKKGAMVSQAEAEAREQVEGLRREVEAEQFRLTTAQNATTAYIAKLKDLCQRELDYIETLGDLVPAPAPKADPVVATAQEIEDAMHRIMTEPPKPEAAEDKEDTKELPDLDGVEAKEARKEQAPVSPEPDEPALLSVGGLYEDLTRKARKEKEDGEDEEEPTRRIDFDHLQFGKDYEIK